LKLLFTVNDEVSLWLIFSSLLLNAYGVSWRFGYASLIFIVTGVKINNLLLLCHMPYHGQVFLVLA